MPFLLLLLLAGCVLPASTIYTYDDDQPNISTYGLANQALIVGFQAVSGANAITGMQLNLFNTGSNSHPLTFALWSDPTNDGNPTDAQLIHTVPNTPPTMVQNYWEPVSFPAPTVIPVGNWFFVGVYATSPSTLFLGSKDTNSTSGNSWHFYWQENTSVDLNNLASGFNYHFEPNSALLGNIMVRAVGDEPPAASVPEPSSVVSTLSGIALIALRAFRRTA